MMTFEERHKRSLSAGNTAYAALTTYRRLWDLSDKLNAYNVLLEPPATIRNANKARIERLRTRATEAWELYMALDKVVDAINAKPYDGGTYIGKGMLPDFTATSTDEAEAMKMLAEYYRRKSA